MSQRGSAVVAAAIAGLTGCGSGGGSTVPEGGSSYGAQRRTQPQKAITQAARPGTADARAVLGLIPERAAGRLMLVGFSGTDASAPLLQRLRVRDFGAVVIGLENYVDDTQLGSLVGALSAAARGAGHAPPIAIGDRLPVAVTALRALHVGATFGPVADLATSGGPHQGDAFSDDARATAAAVGRAVALRTAAGVASAVGHFPGEGSASGDPASEPATVGLTVEELRRADVLPFARVVHSAAAVIMSDAVYAGFDGVTPATELPEAVRMLRDLGFHGVVISGDLTAAAAAGGGSVGDAAVAALRAGCDLLYVPGDAAAQEDAYRSVARAIRSGAVPAGRAAAALRRVVALQRRHSA